MSSTLTGNRATGGRSGDGGDTPAGSSAVQAGGAGDGGAGDGGAVSSLGPGVTIENSTVTQNTSVYGERGDPGDRANGDPGDDGIASAPLLLHGAQLESSTISANIAVFPTSSTGWNLLGEAIARNTIVAGGTCQGSFTSQGHNLDSGSSCGFTSPGDHSNTDPMLGALSFNGGVTRTIAIDPLSPAIDQGTSAGLTSPPTDQRGTSRPQDYDQTPDPAGDESDIGAFELETPPPQPPAPPPGSPGAPGTTSPAPSEGTAGVTGRKCKKRKHKRRGRSAAVARKKKCKKRR